MINIVTKSHEDVFFSNTPETEYTATMNREQLKKLGQFFTPFFIAHFMATWITRNPHCYTILDPAVGLGIFLRAILQETTQKYQLMGYDIDPPMLKRAKALFKDYNDSQLKLIHRDYLLNDWEDRYDGIICNPPYQRFQNYPQRSEILAEFQNRLGITLSGLTNLHTLFLLKSINQLSDNGRAAYLMPSEFLNADYGVFIKKHLIKHQSLRFVIVFDFNENLFANAITTSCILLFDNHHQNAVEFIQLKSLDDLANLERQLFSSSTLKTTGKTVRYQDLDENIKWRTYYQKTQRNQYKNLVPLSTYGKIVRGIATGDNNYFTFNIQKQQEFEITNQNLWPCLTKANQASVSFFTTTNFEQLRLSGKNVYLLNVTQVTDPAIKRYLQTGEQLGTHQKYLTSHRHPWYAVENRPPAPILVTVFNRNGLRFVRNEANIRNLTCFHGFYLDMFALAQIDILMAYLMTDVAKKIFNDNRREYGDGLEKFEPNDLNQSLVIDLQVIPVDKTQEISEIFKAYRAGVIQNQPDLTLLESLNRLFLEFLLK